MEVSEGHGEVVWMDPMEGQFYVVGHVTADEAIEAVREFWLEEHDGEAPSLGPCFHSFGSWIESEDHDPDYSADYPYTWFCSTAYPNNTPVTVVWDQSYWRKREESRAMGAEALTRARSRWPRAEHCEVSAPRGGWEYRESCSVRVRLRSCEFRFYPWRKRARVDGWHTRRGLSVNDALERSGFRRAS